MKPYDRPCFIVDGVDRLLCPIPLKINVYRGCEGHCQYCSMQGQHARWVSRAQGQITDIAPSPIKYIERMFYRSSGMERVLINARYPVQIGHASDPCQPAERRFRILESMLGILKDFEYPTIITTKWPTLLTEDPYLRQLSELPSVVQCSLSSEDQAMLTRLEPEAPTMRRRFAAMAALSDSGVHVILRLWPYIPDLAGNLYEMLSCAKDAGVKAVQCNFLKVPNAGSGMRDYLKETCLPYEQRHNFQILEPEQQRIEIEQLSRTCHEIGLRLLTCDDWTRDRQWQDCCGVGGLPGFKAATWAYYTNGHRITEHTSVDEYLHGIDCPWETEFCMEWSKGTLSKAVPELIYHEEDETYSRLW